MTTHLDRGDDSDLTRARLAARGMRGEIAPQGKPAPVAASHRWPVERTNAWTNAHKKLVWCTERRAAVIALMAGVFGGGHHCPAVGAGWVDALSVGHTTCPQAMSVLPIGASS